MTDRDTITALLDRADAARRSGDDQEALSACLEASRQARELFAPDLEARAMLGVAQIRALGDELRPGRDAFDEAIARAVEGGVPVIEAEAWFGLASTFFDHGRSKDGHDALLEAMALCREISEASPDDRTAKARLARAIRLYGEHIGVLGSESDARQALELARIMYADLGEAAIAQSITADIAALREYSR